MKKLLYLILVLSFFNSCKIVRSLKELSKTKAKVHTCHYNEKVIKFIPLHHLGKKKFFDDVAKKVSHYKSDGYRVYYELTKANLSKLDSLQKDSLARKRRKLLGFSGNYRDAMPIFKKMIMQPSYTSMNVDTLKDLNADVSFIELIQEWERQVGTIVLDSIDINTPLKGEYYRKKSNTKKQWNDVILKCRNARLVKFVKENKDEKILILYGANHRKDFIKQLNSK